MTISNSTILIPFSGTIIDTSAIDPWRQGVEITQFKHFDAGTVKIRSGEKGHRLAVLNFVADRLDDLPQLSSYVDEINLLNAENIINDRSHRSHDLTKNVNGAGYIQAGIIEPLSKFRKASTACDGDGILLQDVHYVKAEVDIIKNVYDLEANRSLLPFDDGKNPNLSFHNQTFSQSVVPYTEFIVPDINNSSDLNSALSRMNPETENYISDKQFTGTCGTSYDGSIRGTDSMAFGGQVY